MNSSSSSSLNDNNVTPTPSNPSLAPTASDTSTPSLPFPEPAHLSSDEPHDALRNTTTNSSSELEATELRPIVHSKPRRLSRVISPGKPLQHWYDPGKKFWRHEVRISVPHEDCRDHLANERTFLGYLRTSIALSIVGVMIAQLYRLQHRPHPDPTFGYFVLSKPLSMIFQSAALLVVLLGGVRFYRQQHAMAVGKVYSGGWEVLGTGLGSLVLLVMMFVLHVALDIYKRENGEP